MAKVLDLTSRLAQKELAQGADPEEVLERLLGMQDGEVMFVFNIKGDLRYQVQQGQRFEIDPTKL